MNRKLLLLLTMVALAAVGLGGCSTLSYYSQSVIGHSKLMLARKPIEPLLKDSPSELKRQLQLIVQLREFAVEELGLPDNDSYTQYVSLDREYPVWNVVAAPEFSLSPKQWCYPVIGCAAYRGYFKKEAALEYAKSVDEAGFDTTVAGATAYSTLGWFADPILSSMLRYDDASIAETLFHELAHQRLYVNGDSQFNEAFATVVGEYGAKQWLQKHHPDKLPDYEQQLAAVAQFNGLILASKQRLAAVYQSAVPSMQMRVDKQAEFRRLQTEYDAVKANSWQGRGWFDHWFNTPLNNARLAAFSTYRDHVPLIANLLEKCENSWPKFYRVLSTAKKVDGVVVIPGTCSMVKATP